jgi:glutathione S-transferase
MILIGQYDSPFVRRVAVALRVYEIAYEHWSWSTFGDAEKLAAYNPLRRVPTLVLDSGEVLIESGAILDYLDEQVGPDRAMIAPADDNRRATLKLCALATGLCDKMVGLIYERALHDATSPVWIARCEAQVSAVLDSLEQERASRPFPFMFSNCLTHADVVLACAMRFLREAHGETFELGRWPALGAHAEHCEALEVFRSVVQPFTPPGR